MSARKDLVGLRVKRLTVIEFVETRVSTSGRYRAYWKCKCACGNETIVSSDALLSGTTGSCGCGRFGRKIVNKTPRKFKDLSGLKIHFLTFIKRVFNRGKVIFWLCRCDCGNLIEVSSSKVKYGHTKSCGCLHKQKCSERAVERNKLMVGEDSPRWNHNLSDEDRSGNKVRNLNPKVHRWRKKVFNRDLFTCQTCGSKNEDGEGLVSHHIFSWDNYVALRFIINNGICLCTNCHKEFHGMFGYGDNNQRQFNEFVRSKNRTYEI